ncbi:MAG: hypothetical protein ACLRW4_02490 [Ruminococcus sp.]
MEKNQWENRVKWIKLPNFAGKARKKPGGVDTNRAGWYFIKKTGMVKFVEIGKKGINNTADA